MRVTRIIDMLSAYLSAPVILSNQAAPRPPYPYIGITETIQYSPGSEIIENEPLPEDIKQVYISQPTFTLSVTAYGKEFDETIDLAERAHAWFRFVGRDALKQDGFVVVNVGDITNRDSLLIDDYERRRGFDAQIRFTEHIERVIEEIKKVKGKMNNLPFEADKG